MEDNNMIKTTVKVDGMMCGMCESHVNDAVKKSFPGRIKSHLPTAKAKPLLSLMHLSMKPD